MSKMTKTVALFFAALIFFISISEENYTLLLSSYFQKSGSENSDSFLSSGKTDLFFLDNQEGRVATTVSNLPGSKSKNNLNDFYITGLSQLSGSQITYSGYTSYSEAENLNLTVRDIIFPFHYFW